MFRILLRKISVFCRNAPINAKRFIQDRDTSISLWVIEVIIVMLFYSIYKLPSCEPGSKKRFINRLCRIMLHESEIPEIHSEVTMNLTFTYLTSHLSSYCPKFPPRMISSSRNLPSFSSIGAIILSSDSPNTSFITNITA